MTKADITKQVVYELATNPKSRNNDILLTQLVWEDYYPQFITRDVLGDPMIYLRDLYAVPNQDDIKRIRAKIQNEDRLYLPTDINIFIKRAKNSKEWRTFLGYKPEWKDEHWSDAVKNYLQPKQTTLL